MQAKRKVSVTVGESLPAGVDRLAGDLSRSAVFEQALVFWLRQYRQAALDCAIERYYPFLNRDESAEDDVNRLFSEQHSRHFIARLAVVETQSALVRKCRPYVTD